MGKNLIQVTNIIFTSFCFCAATWEFFPQVEQSDAQISLNLEPQQGCSFQS